MGRMYAGVLGPVAFVTTLARGLIDAGGVETTLKVATFCLFAFAAIGYVAGRIADLMVIETVRARIHEEIQARETATEENVKQSA
ncbi:MAG: hypothetical protein ACC628_16300 [Pirellulaceae bacterium]